MKSTTEFGSTLSRLQPGMVVRHQGEEWRVVLVNDCRAQIVPLIKRETVVKQIVDGVEKETARFMKSAATQNISPNSEIEIVAWPKEQKKNEPDLSGDKPLPSPTKRGRGRPKKLPTVS